MASPGCGRERAKRRPRPGRSHRGSGDAHGPQMSGDRRGGSATADAGVGGSTRSDALTMSTAAMGMAAFINTEREERRRGYHSGADVHRPSHPPTRGSSFPHHLLFCRPPPADSELDHPCILLTAEGLLQCISLGKRSARSPGQKKDLCCTDTLYQVVSC